MLMNPKNGEAVSWSEEQKRFYKAFPHAHLEFTPDSLYAQNIVSVVLARTHLRGEWITNHGILSKLEKPAPLA